MRNTIFALALCAFALSDCRAAALAAPPLEAVPLTLSGLQLEALAHLAASPLTASEIQEVLTEPVDDTQYDVVTQDITTSAVALVPEVAANNRTALYVQSLRIQNRHASNRICVWFKLMAPSADCATACAASPKTCNASSTDGAPINAGAAPYKLPITGRMCACAIANAAATTTTTERVQRAGR